MDSRSATPLKGSWFLRRIDGVLYPARVISYCPISGHVTSQWFKGILCDKSILDPTCTFTVVASEWQADCARSMSGASAESVSSYSSIYSGLLANNGTP